MTTDERFDRTLSRWLREEAGHPVPDHLGEVLMQTAATRQRPRWSSPERWLPMDSVATRRPLNLRPIAMLMFAVGAVLLAALAAVWVAGQRTSPPFGLAQNGRIFSLEGQTLKSYAPDGTDPRVELDLPATASALTMSPDGRLVAFVGEGSNAEFRLEVLDITDGTTTTVPTPGAVNIRGPISWSPDGTKLLFGTCDGSGEHLLIGSPDGAKSNEIDVSSIVPPSVCGRDLFELQMLSPAGWAPTGDRVAFAVRYDDAPTGIVFVVRPDGSELQRLDTTPVVENITWSPDPAVQQLLYMTPDAKATSVFDIATGTEYDVDLFWPTWSPDGHKIAGCCAEVVDIEDVLAGEARVTEVFTPHDATECGPDFRSLSGRAVCSPAVWSPDGKSLLASDIAGNGLLMAPIDGSALPTRIETDSEHLGNVTFAWQPIRN